MPRSPDDPHLSKQELAQFRAEVRAFELRHHARRRSHRANGISWKHLQRKLDEAARGAAKLELTASEVQRLAQAVTSTPAPAPAPTPRRRHLSARERRALVRLARRGTPYRAIARRFGVPFQTVAYWVRRAGSQPLDAIDWRNRAPGPVVPHNKIDPRIEHCVILTRERLRDEHQAYGPDAILEILRVELRHETPSRKTVVRIIRRNGLIEARRGR